MFEVYISMINDLHSVLNAHHPKSDYFLSPYAVPGINNTLFYYKVISM